MIHPTIKNGCPENSLSGKTSPRVSPINPKPNKTPKTPTIIADTTLILIIISTTPILSPSYLKFY